MVLDPTTSSTNMLWHKPPTVASTTVVVPANQGDISASLAPDSDSERKVEVAALMQLPKYQEMCSDKILKDQRPVRALSMKPEVSARDCHILRARASCTANHQTCKRKIDSHDGVDTVTDKENIMISLGHTPTIKRICREKSGTEWQSVLDVIEFGEEQRRKDTVTLVMEEKS